MTYSFHSFLKRELADYLDFKTALGYTTFASKSLLSVANAFDYYLTFRALSTFDQLTDGVIFNWIYAIRSHAPRTRNKYLFFARGFGDYLVRRGLIARNPARRVQKLKAKPFHPYLFTIKELQDILAAAAVLRNPSALFPQTLATFYHLLYAGALRVGEAMRLRIRDVDFEQNTLSLWKTKFHKERLVPFSEPTARRLAAYLARRAKAYPPTGDEAPFFVHRGKPLYYVLVHSFFHRCLEAAGVPHRVKGGARLHDLRHAAAVNRLYNGTRRAMTP